jgi:small ligand-binding sensory domain FIST
VRALATRIGSGLSTEPAAANAAVDAARQARTQVGGEVDLAFIFLSPDHVDTAGEAVHMLFEELSPRHLLGCVGEGVLAGTRELESGPAVAVWAASLPGAEIEPFHAVGFEIEDGIGIEGFPDPEDASLVTLLVDPFTFPAGPFLAELNEEYPGLPVVGGIAAGAGEPGAQALVVDGELHEEGAVGAVLSNVPVLAVVSQGCSPVGTDAVITRAEGNVVFELAGRPALERLRDEIAALPPDRRRLAAQGILAGVVIDENRAEYRRGDYLMRGILGADESSGALAVGEEVRVGQTLRFHVRDAASADEDLVESLRVLDGGRSAGALLFTCNGRGTHMFQEPDHDARVVAEGLETSAIAGMFCAGEIGPVGGNVFLHGFTATMAVFLGSQPSELGT